MSEKLSVGSDDRVKREIVPDVGCFAFISVVLLDKLPTALSRAPEPLDHAVVACDYRSLMVTTRRAVESGDRSLRQRLFARGGEDQTKFVSTN
jgi:hypothetical protein